MPWEECSSCDGRGEVYDYGRFLGTENCFECRGHGFVRARHKSGRFMTQAEFDERQEKRRKALEELIRSNGEYL